MLGYKTWKRCYPQTTSKALDLLQKISANAAFDDAEIPNCTWLTREELSCVRVDDPPLGGTVSIQLKDVSGNFQLQNHKSAFMENLTVVML